jgi:succinyl-CoA synthetase alpha subunit
MSVLVDQTTRVVIQGITGGAGSLHAKLMIEYGTKVVAGVTPGKGGRKFEDKVPIFNTVEQAVRETGADASVVFVPPSFAADSVMEAADAGIPLVVCITEGIRIVEEARLRPFLKARGTRMIGPNCPGIITPGETKLGIMPGYIHKRGRVGVVSRSGTLTYEAVWQLSELGIGQSTCIGIGGDPVQGLEFVPVLELFNADARTEAIVLIGEIGGTMEEDAADYIRRAVKKPVIAFVGGATAPPGKRMGHAGAIVSGGKGTAAEKIKALKEAGAHVVESPAEIGARVKQVLA